MDPLSWLGLGLDVLAGIRKVIGKKISVTPTEVNLGGPSKSSKTATVYIQNKTDKPLFEISIVCWYNERKVKSLDFKSHHEPDFRSITDVDADVAVSVVMGSKNGKKFKLLQIDHLAAHSELAIDIKADGQEKIKFQAVAFNEKGDRVILQDDGSIAVPFKPPFDMEVEGIGMIMRKS